MKFRLLKTNLLPAAENMAIDEAVLDELAAGHVPPTLRIYGWSPMAISIGFFQSLQDEVDLEACAQQKVDYVRRITGGGAVFHQHEVTYSILIPEKLNIVPSGILESYEAICRGIICGLDLLGIKATFAPINDIVVNYNGVVRKISGNAQTRRKGIILQHGTILLKVDVEKMFSLLKVPDEKLKGKLIQDVKQRVTGISNILGRELSFEEGSKIVENGFAVAFPKIEFLKGELSPEEKKLIKSLTTNKYGSSEWKHKR